MSMELDLGPNARAFRDEVRGWLQANWPEALGLPRDPAANGPR